MRRYKDLKSFKAAVREFAYSPCHYNAMIFGNDHGLVTPDTVCRLIRIARLTALLTGEELQITIVRSPKTIGYQLPMPVTLALCRTP